MEPGWGARPVQNHRAGPPGCGPTPVIRLSVRKLAVPGQPVGGKPGAELQLKELSRVAGNRPRATSSWCPARGCCLSSSGGGKPTTLDVIRAGLLCRKLDVKLFELEIAKSYISLIRVIPAEHHVAVGDWRSLSPGPAHCFPAASSKATAPGRPAAEAKRYCDIFV